MLSNIYFILDSNWEMFAELYTASPVINVGIVTLMFAAGEMVNYLAIYLFLAFGMFTMARRRNMSIAWLAFLPVANFYLLGKLIGDAEFYGFKIKGMGIIALVSVLVMLAANVTADIVYGRILIYGYEAVFNPAGKEFIEGLYARNWPLTGVVATIVEIVDLVFRIICFMLAYFLFRNYAPRSCWLFSIIAFLFPLVGAILVFAIRKNSCDEYREFMKMKMHSMYGGGNPYSYDGGEYSDPFDLSKNDGKRGEQPPEKPFGEYDDGKKN